MFVSFYAAYVQINEVKAIWLKDELRVVSTRNGIVVTHLVGFSQGQRVVAVLPEPPVEFDSGGPFFDYTYLSHLRWLDRHQKQWPPPAIGSRMFALYYRPTVSESTDRSPLWRNPR
jgi:hypothetical protein